MNKLIWIEQALSEGLNRVKVAQVLPVTSDPPKNCFAYCEFSLLDILDSKINSTPKYEVDIDVNIVNNEIVSINLISEELIEIDTETIEADEVYIATVKEKRKAEYAKEVDGLNFELVEMLATGILNGKVKIDGADSETLAQTILYKKQEIKDKIK